MAALQILAIPSGIAVVCALPSGRIHRFHHVPKPLRRRTSAAFERSENHGRFGCETRQEKPESYFRCEVFFASPTAKLNRISRPF
jgi:hypothetical protein